METAGVGKRQGPGRTRPPARAWFVRLGLLAAVLAIVISGPPRLAADDLPQSGVAVPGMASFDRVFPALLARWDVPGAAVAVCREGRLVLARAYGWADLASRRPLGPTAVFRLASLSKPVTAVAVLKLVEAGRLRLESPVLPLVVHLLPAGKKVGDPRWAQVTVRHLLLHLGGWDAAVAGDPMFQTRAIAETLGVPSPASPDQIVSHILTQPLQFTPGEKHVYSNFGYCLLGRVIEKVSGQGYEAWVRANVLLPAGAGGLRLGRTLPAQRRPDEVTYHPFPGSGQGASVFGPPGVEVPWPDGGWSLEAMDAHGGWTGSTLDCLRFLLALDQARTQRPLLSRSSLQTMLAPPGPPLPPADCWYGMGWNVRPVPDAVGPGSGRRKPSARGGADPGPANWWHMGSLDGSTTLLVRTHHGLAWAVLCNGRPPDPDAFSLALDQAVWEAVEGVSAWPAHDLWRVLARP